MRPRKKHINVKYHNFRSYVANSTISILPIESSKQPENILTCPLNKAAFIHHGISIMGGGYCKATSKYEATNQNCGQEATDAIH